MTSGNLLVVVSPKVVPEQGTEATNPRSLQFFFMCGKGLNYIDLRSVLAIDRSQGVKLLGTCTTQQLTTSG